ncbi:MAG: DMT family transporter [Deltaproteobacteria bacterium]
MSQVPERTLFGIALMLGFCAIAPLIDVFSKLAAETLPVGQVTAARYVVQALVLGLVIIILRLQPNFQRRNLGSLFGAAILSLGATYTFIAAIDQMPLADALAIAFVEPFILLLIGHFFLGHVIGWRRLLGAVVGFIGVLIIIRPTFQEVGAAAFLPLGTALFFALYMLEMRRLSQRISPVVLQFQVALAASVLAVPALFALNGGPWPEFGLDYPVGKTWIWVLSIGAASSVSHLLPTNALKNATSTVLAPLHYLEIVSATAFGYFVFADFPDGLKLLGILIVIASGLYVIYRERLAKVRVPPPANLTGG